MSSFVIKYLPIINVLLNTHTIHVPKLSASCTVLYQSNLTVCLLVCGFSSHLRIFHSYGDVTIADEGLQILLGTRGH